MKHVFFSSFFLQSGTGAAMLPPKTIQRKERQLTNRVSHIILDLLHDIIQFYADRFPDEDDAGRSRHTTISSGVGGSWLSDMDHTVFLKLVRVMLDLAEHNYSAEFTCSFVNTMRLMIRKFPKRFLYSRMHMSTRWMSQVLYSIPFSFLFSFFVSYLCIHLLTQCLYFPFPTQKKNI